MQSRLSWIIILAVFLASVAIGQNADIAGNVVDSLTGERIPYAIITFIGQGKAKAATSSGTYFLSNLQPGVHLFSVQATGFKSKNVRMFVARDQHLKENIELIPAFRDEEQAMKLKPESTRGPSSIHGVVSDSLTGERIPYANVVLVGQNRGTAANSPGFYFLTNVTPGENTLVFSALGYGRITLTVNIDPRTDLELDVTLPLSPIETEEVVVTSTARGRLGELNTSLHMITQQEIKLTPVTAQQDLFHALQIIPGIVSTSDVSSRFYVRGGAADQNLIMLDGMVIFNPYHALGIFSIFDPDIVKTVEVFTGAFPAEFGDRLSSVVNITTKDPRNDRFSAKAQGNFLSSKLQMEGPIGQGISFLANTRRSISSGTFKKIVNEDVPLSFNDLYVKSTIQGGGNERFDVAFLSSSDILEYEDPYTPAYTWHTNAVSASASYLIGNRIFFDVTTHYGSYQAERRFNPGLGIPPTSTKVLDFGLRASAAAYLQSGNIMLFGFQIGFPRFLYTLTNTLGVGLLTDQTQPQFSTWVQYQGRSGQFLFSAGMHNDLTNIFYRRQLHGLIQPRLSASYLFSEWWRLKASYGHFTQKVMTVNNEDDVIPSFEGWIVIPENWPLESSDHYVIALEGNLYDNVSVSSEVYYKHYASILTYNREKFDSADPDYIGGTEDALGVEFLLRAKWSSIDIYSSYTLSMAKVNNGGVVYYPRFDRRHHANAIGLIRPCTNIEMIARWEYGSGFPFTQTIGFLDRLTLKNAIPGHFEFETGIPYTLLGSKNGGRLPPYHRLDLSASYHFELMSLIGSFGVSLINVYNGKNIFYYDRASGKRVNMIPFFPSLNVALQY